MRGRSYLDKELIFDLPLVYGMCYGGAGLTYKFEFGDLTVLEMEATKPSDDFPYAHFPAILPFVPLAVSEQKKQSWRQFNAPYPNLPDDQPSDLIVVVPPPMTIGVSLWGREGDAEGVTLVFECDLKLKRVKAYNVCT